MARYFAKVGEQNQTDIFRRYKMQMEYRPLDIEGNDHPYNKIITQKEFEYAVKANVENSPGPDKITYSMIKQAHATCLNLILKLYNKILVEREFPDNWKITIVIPIYKGNGTDFLKNENYRPISLTNCLCKILEKIINIRLVWFLERNNNIIAFRSDFRQRRSTTDHLVLLANTIRQQMTQKRHTIAVFFNIQKAFDSAWSHYIIMKLQQYGLPGHLIQFIQNFLQNRQSKVRINGAYSETENLNTGIPPESVLNCTCFMIAINEVANKLPLNLHKTA